MRKPLVRAVIDGAAQIAIPTFVSTLAICIVFVPVLLLTGTAKYLFTPLAMAVVFAMLASYLLSRTLVPTMAHYLLKSEVEMYQQGIDGEAKHGKGLFWRLHYWFDGLFERLRFRYLGLLDWSLRHRAPVLTAFMVVSDRLAGPGLAGRRGFLPQRGFRPDAAARAAPAGTRIEQTEVRFAAIEREIRDVIPADEMDTLIDNIGIVNCWACLAQGEIPTISSADGEILISLKKNHGSTRDYEVRLRKRLREQFPDTTFFFQPANITTQILNFGLPAPIDLQVVGRDAEANYKIAQKLAERISHIPGAADVHVHQVIDQPEIRLNVDRVKGVAIGFDAARRDQQHADLSQRQRHGGAELLDELGQRRQLHRGCADAAIQRSIRWMPCCARRCRSRPTPSTPPRRVRKRARRRRECFGGRFSERLLAGLRKSRSHRRQHAAAFESGYRQPRLRPGDRQPL